MKQKQKQKKKKKNTMFNPVMMTRDLTFKPESIDPERVDIVFKENGGYDFDHVIYVRPGLKDLNFGANRKYAQVRIVIHDKYYIQGLAIYRDDLPDGTDILVHTAQSVYEPLYKEVFRPLCRKKSGKINWKRPFVHNCIQNTYRDDDGNLRVNLINIVDVDKTLYGFTQNIIQKTANIVQKTDCIPVPVPKTIEEIKAENELSELMYSYLKRRSESL